MNSNLAVVSPDGPRTLEEAVVIPDAPRTLEEALAALAESEAENLRLREAVVDKAKAATLLTELSIKNGGLELQLEGGMCQLFAHSFADQFRKSGAENYLEMSFRTEDGMDLQVTLQRVRGKTPGRLRTEADARTRVVEDLARGALQAWSSTSGNVPEAMNAIKGYFAEKDGPVA